ncbi:MAG: TolC family protein [Burkholderiales bacterium]|nr:TolC family protein [Burkholderiales bacterium]
MTQHAPLPRLARTARLVAVPTRGCLPGSAPAGVTLASLVNLISLVLAGCVLAGCTSLAPSYQRPQAPVPAALPWPAAASAVGLPATLPMPPRAVDGAASGANTAAPAPARAAASAPGGVTAWSWRTLVRDPRQAELIDLALANNRDLRVAMLNVERARALLGVSEADRLPTVGAGLNASRSPSPSTGNQVNSYSAGVQVTAWELDFFGRIASLNDAARAQVLASSAGQRSAELSLVAALLSADLSLAADQHLVAITTRSLASRRDTLELTRLREKVGAASGLELQGAISLVAQAEVELLQAGRQRQLDLNALTLLVGAVVPVGLLPPEPPPAQVAQLAVGSGAGAVSASGSAASASSTSGSTDTAMSDSLFGAGFAEVPAGLGSDVLLDRPDVVQAEQLLIGATANIGAARAAFWPRISLTGSAGLASSQLGNLVQAGSFAWTLAGQALVTVFDSGRNSANVKVNEVNRDVAIAAYEKALQSAFRETADALAGLQSWRDQVAAQARLRDASRDTARLTALRYSRGAASELERLDAERNLLAAEQALVATRLAERQNRVALFKALGR